MFFYIKIFKSSFSQFGEDKAILKYFKDKNINKGNFIDIGAFHPIWISNTYLLSSNDWSGVVIDLDQEKLDLFKIFRNKDQVINKAVVTSDFHYDHINYYKFNRFFSEINTVDKKFAISKSKETGFSFFEKKLKVIKINDLLDLLENKINFLNIDAEGIDEELILDIDFNKNKIDLICLESHDLDFKKKKLYKYLISLKYNLIYESRPSFCFGK